MISLYSYFKFQRISMLQNSFDEELIYYTDLYVYYIMKNAQLSSFMKIAHIFCVQYHHLCFEICFTELMLFVSMIYMEYISQMQIYRHCIVAGCVVLKGSHYPMSSLYSFFISSFAGELDLQGPCL